MLYDLVKILVLPPAVFFLLLLAGWLLLRWRRPFGRALLGLLLLVAYLSTTPYAAGELMAPLQRYDALDLRRPDPEAGAIVVLSAGLYFSAPEYWHPGAPSHGVDVPGSLTLERLQYAARLARATGLPVLVSGGAAGRTENRFVADAMKQSLERDFGVPVRWVERRSVDTFSNARNSAALLRADGIGRAYLVTHAWHMPRALIAFGATGLDVVPAPTRFVSRAEPRWRDFLPSARAFLYSYYALHEWAGIAWYRLRGGA